MAKTLAQLRTNVRMYLDEVDSADWKDAQLNTQINFRYLSMYSAIIDTYENYYRKVVTTSTVADQSEYALPDDFLKMQRLEVKYQSGDNYRKATFIDTERIPGQLGTDSYSSATRPAYSISGEYLELITVPTESVSSGLKMYYIYELPELSADTDELNIPFVNRYAHFIALGAAGDLLRKGQQEETAAARYIAEFELGLQQMKSQLEDRFGGVKTILDTENDIISFDNELLTPYTYN